MNLRDFGLLSDENVHPEVVAFLRRQGWDVLDVKEKGWNGADDVALIRTAFEANRVVLTHDSDFGVFGHRRWGACCRYHLPAPRPHQPGVYHRIDRSDSPTATRLGSSILDCGGAQGQRD
ncbi:MAG: DUF5615 family PIN-like protein [Acidobacteria bacterium]|nr:DUF5615 family PIN-like protein [Acidobacteriota bacterium]